MKQLNYDIHMKMAYKNDEYWGVWVEQAEGLNVTLSVDIFGAIEVSAITPGKNSFFITLPLVAHRDD